MKIVSNNEEPVEPAPDRYQFVVEIAPGQHMEAIYTGVISYAGPLLAILPYEPDDETMVEPLFAIPYHRLVFLKKLDREEVQVVN